MEKGIVRLIPINNNIIYDNGPTIPLNVARHIQSLSTMLDDITLPPTKEDEKEEEIPFELHNCDNTTAHQLSTCLMTYHEKRDQLTTHIDSFNTNELIKLTNITDTIDARPLEQPLLVVLCKALNNKPDPVLRQLNLDVQKKIATMLMSCNQYDTKLLQPYSDSLDSKTQLYKNAFISTIRGSEELSYYFNKETGTLLNGTKKDDCITHIHIASRHDNPFVALVNNIRGTHAISFDLKQHNFNLSTIYHVTANNNETLFICACRNDKAFKTIVFDTVNKSILQTYTDYCFGENNHELYVTDIRNLYSLNTQTNTAQQISFLIGQSERIIKIASNCTSTHIVIATHNPINNISHLYMGYKNNDVFTFLPITTIDLTGKQVDSLVLNKTATVLCVGAYDALKLISDEDFSYKYYIYNLQNHLQTEILPERWFAWHSPPMFTHDGNLLIIPIEANPKYMFYNTLTHNCWEKKVPGNGVIIAPLTAHGEQCIKLIHNSTEHTNTVTAVTLVDNTIKCMLNHIKTDDIPLVVCSIAEQLPGIITLNDEDYQEYNNSAQAIQDVVNASYIITSPHWQSRLGGFMYNVYKKIRRPLFFITGFIAVISVSYLLQTYTPVFHGRNKHAVDALSALLRLITQL